MLFEVSVSGCVCSTTSRWIQAGIQRVLLITSSASSAASPFFIFWESEAAPVNPASVNASEIPSLLIRPKKFSFVGCHQSRISKFSEVSTDSNVSPALLFRLICSVTPSNVPATQYASKAIWLALSQPISHS